MGGPDILQPLTPTALRAQILSASDLHAAVSAIDSASATEVKVAAVEAIHACMTAARTKVAAGTPQALARQELGSRCRGFQNWGQMRRRALELQSEIDSDAESRLGKLTHFAQRSLQGKQRLRPDDAQLLTDAFNSRDFVLVREASRAAFAHLNDNSPDAQLRGQALFFAVDLLGMDQPTRFDYLTACANLDRCTADWFPAMLEQRIKDPRELAETKRLVSEYHLALQRGVSAEEVLRLR